VMPSDTFYLRNAGYEFICYLFGDAIICVEKLFVDGVWFPINMVKNSSIFETKIDKIGGE